MKQVLVVESNEDQRAYLQRELGKIYDVHICTRGDYAVEMVEQLRPDALIINLSLPNVDGLTVLRQLKRKPPVILALTNLLNTRIITDIASQGVQDMLLYPCTATTIATHLDDIMHMK